MKKITTFLLATVLLFATAEANTVTKKKREKKNDRPVIEDSYRYYLVIDNADDRIVITYNGNILAALNTENDRSPNFRKDITDLLLSDNDAAKPENKRLYVEGHNGATTIRSWPFLGAPLNDNPWHFKYHVEKVNIRTGEVKDVLVNNDIRGGSPDKEQPGYLAYSTYHHLVK